MLLLASAFLSIKPRRHSDPPLLWAVVLSGSVLVNLGGIAGLGRLFSSPPVTSQPAPILVEFYLPPTAEHSAASPVGGTDSAAAKVAAPPTPSSPSLAQTTVLPDRTVLTSTVSATPISPPRHTKAEDQSDGRSRIARPPAPQSDVQKPSPKLPPKPSLSPSPTSTSPTKTPDPEHSNAPIPDLPPDVDPSRRSEDPLQSVTVSSVSVPAEFLAQITPLPDTLGNFSSPGASPAHLPATIKGDTSRTFSSDAANCRLTPDALHGFGQVVVARVAIDEKGNPAGQNPISIQQPSGNDSYDQLAICALQTWSFNPAYELTGSNNRLYKPSYLNIEITIRQS